MPPPLDLTYLHRLCKGNRARMEEYVALYLQETPELFAQLEAKLSGGDGSQLAKAAHGIRPHAHCMGAAQLSELLGQLQERASTAGTAACTGLVKESVALHEELKQSILAWQRSGLGAENR